MEPYEETIQDKLKRDALKRITNYVHPQIRLEHQPINAREFSQLQEQMRQLVRQKVEIVKQEYEARSFGRQYQKVYEEFMSMTGRNQAQHQRMCSDIRQMHQMADMLLHPPDINDDKLYLSSGHPSSPAEEQQFNLLMKKYEKMHKQGYELDDYNSQQIIQRAKNYYLRDRS